MEPAKAADLVVKLRAKAASTNYPEEAKLLTEKADKLARRYRVKEQPPPRPRPAPPFVPDVDRGTWYSIFPDLKRPRWTAAGRWSGGGVAVRLEPEVRPDAGQRDAYCDESGNLFGG